MARPGGRQSSAAGTWAWVRGVRRPKWWSAAVWLVVLAPGVGIILGLASDLTRGTRFLGSEPVKAGEQLFGLLTMRYLVATLAVTPIRRILGWNWVQKERRTLGLAAFFTGLGHLMWYVLLDAQLDLGQLRKDFAERPYIIVGLLGVLVMVPLALTSTRKAVAKLRGRWLVLHRLTYVVPALGLIHWWMSVKADIRQPAAYSVLLATLLVWRLTALRGRSRDVGAAG